MRNLKKVLSLVLCVAMMLSVMVVGAGAAFSDQSKIKNTEAVDACTALNIIGGYPDGSFKPEGNITRAEVTKMICVALNGGKNPAVSTNTTPTFSDVRNNANAAWAEGYIESCAAQGIVSGVGGGKFAPNGNVTGVQLAKMLLVSLGYKSENEGFTGNAWATNVNVRAAQKGLYAGLEKMDSNAAITRDNAARMVWNALQAYEVEYKTDLVADKNGKLSTQVTVSDKVDGNFKKITLLRDKYDAWTNIGTLTAVQNNVITLTMTDADKATSDLVNKDKDSVDFSKVDKDYSALIGQKVKVLFKNGKTNDVIGVYATSDNTVYETVMSAVDRDGSKVKFNDTSYSVDNSIKVYVDGTRIANASDNKNKTDFDASDFDDTASLLNGSRVVYGTNDVFTSKIVKGSLVNAVSGATVKFIDSDDNSKIDTAIITLKKVAKVTYVSSSSIIADGTTYKYADENIAKDLKKDDWVVISENNYNDNKDIVKVEKTQVTINGTKSKSNYDQYRVDGTWTNANPSNKDVDVKAGNKADVVVYNGVLFYAKKTSSTSGSADIALVVDKGSFNQAKLAFMDGTTKTVTIDDDSERWSAGNVYVYEVNGDEYKLTAFNTTNLDNDDYTIVNGALTNADKVGTVNIADSAKVLLWSNDTTNGIKKVKYVTGKQYKSLTTSNYSLAGALSEKVDGMTKVSNLVVQVGATMPGDFQTNDNYAVVVSDAYKYDSDYICYDIFNGKDTITVTEKKTYSDANKRETGDIIGYSKITDAKVIEDVTRYQEGAASSTTIEQNKYSVGAIQGVNSKGDEITVNGTDTFKITNDTKIFFIDSDAENNKDDFKGIPSDATKIDSTYEADEIGDSEVYYFNCAYILDTNVNSEGKADLSVLVIDVKNRMANNKETAKTVTLSEVTATINDAPVTSGTTTLSKGQIMMVKASKAGTLKVVGAHFSDGTDSKTVKANDVVGVYADSTATPVSVSYQS